MNFETIRIIDKYDIILKNINFTDSDKILLTIKLRIIYFVISSRIY